jgi:hypothetical protein
VEAGERWVVGVLASQPRSGEAATPGTAAPPRLDPNSDTADASLRKGDVMANL